MEKSKACLMKVVVAGVVLALGCMVPWLEADAPPAPATNTPATATVHTDPFVKKDAVVPPDEAGPFANLIFTFEVYNLSQTDGAKLLQENETDQARHDRVLDLVKNGKARFANVLCEAVKSGQQAVVEQLYLVPYAISFRYLAGIGAVATDFKQRNIGYRVVVKGQTSADKKGYYGNMFFENTVLKGFLNQYTTNTGGTIPYSVALALFDTRRVNSIPPFFPFEQIRFLGTYNPTPSVSFPSKAPTPNGKVEDSEMILVFGKVSQVQLDSGTPTADKPASFEQQFSLYSMDREKAREILSQKQKMDSAYQAVQSLVKTNQAKLEHFSVLRTNSGIKSDIDEVAEVTYPVAAADQFVTQDVGFGAEVSTAFIGHTSLLTINVTKSQLMDYLQNLPTEGVAASFHQSMPLFECSSVVTQINSALGEHELLGTISPAESAGLNGQKDTGRVWLEFIRTTDVNP